MELQLEFSVPPPHGVHPKYLVNNTRDLKYTEQSLPFQRLNNLQVNPEVIYYTDQSLYISRDYIMCRTITIYPDSRDYIKCNSITTFPKTISHTVNHFLSKDYTMFRTITIYPKIIQCTEQSQSI